MRLTHHLTPSIDFSSATITIVEQITSGAQPGIEPLLASHYMTVMQTRDSMVREALIKLGWTPPPDQAILHSARGDKSTGA